MSTNKINECPKGKELNPLTGRYVNICKEGTVRNPATGKCDKIIMGKRGRPKKQTPNEQPARSNPQKKPNTPPKKSPDIKPYKFSSPSSSSSSSSSSSKRSHSSQYSQRSPHSQRSHSSQSSQSSSKNEFELYYPDLDDPDFTSKISNNKEFLIHKIPDYPEINNVADFDAVSNKLCGKFDKMLYQHFVSQYISYRTPYKSLLLYHGVGVGKTCAAITISEALLSSQTTTEPMIWVIMPQSLKNSFKSQVFNIDDFDTFDKLSNQCT